VPRITYRHSPPSHPAPPPLHMWKLKSPFGFNQKGNRLAEVGIRYCGKLTMVALEHDEFQQADNVHYRCRCHSGCTFPRYSSRGSRQPTIFLIVTASCRKKSPKHPWNPSRMLRIEHPHGRANMDRTSVPLKQARSVCAAVHNHPPLAHITNHSIGNPRLPFKIAEQWSFQIGL